MTHPRWTKGFSEREMSRRELLWLFGASASALSVSGLVAACGSDQDDDADGAAESGASDPTATPTADDSRDSASTESTGNESTPAATTGDSTADESQAGDERPELIVAIQELPGGLEPHLNSGNIGVRVTYSIFDFLIERDFAGGDPAGTGSELRPMLAESWERIDDLTIEFKLREDVRFHNGDPLTAEDVKFSFDRLIIDPAEELLAAARYVNTLSRVEAIDDYTVRLSTAEPDPILLNRLASYGSWILPKAHFEEVGMDAFNQSPVGTGPLRFVEMVPDRLVLEAFDDYWGGEPTASRVEFRVIPEVAGRVAALVSGEVGIITNVPPDQVETIEDAADVEVRSVPLSNVHILVFNTSHPVTRDKRLRQAMRLGIDRQLLIDSLWGGRAVLPRSLQFEEYGPLFNPDRVSEYDPDQARGLVEASDYSGETITFWLTPGYYTLGLEAAQVIIEMWREIGIDAEIVAREDLSAAPPDEIMVRNVSNTNFHADPDSIIWIGWGEGGFIQSNFWTPESPRFNELGEAARLTLDLDERYAAYQEMLDIWEDESPGTVLYIPAESYGLRTGVDWTPYSFWFMDLRPDNLRFE